MSVAALLFAAGLAQSPAALGDHFAVSPRPQFADAAPCPPLRQRLQPTSSRRQAPVGATRLGDLPKANLTLTVLRSVDGCAVSSTVRYKVEGDGRAPPATAE